MTTTSPPPAVAELDQRVFTLEDQLRFGALSHDLNPMHVDPLAARRLLTGQPVVHGIHTLLWALDRCQGIGTSEPCEVDCQFSQPINVGDRVLLQQQSLGDGRSLISASVGGVVCTRIELRAAAATTAAAARPTDGAPVQRLQPAAQAGEQPVASHQGRIYVLDDWAHDLAPHFPSFVERWGRDAVGALAGLSYVVGMVCPGLHSVFSSLVFRLTPARPASAEPSALRVQLREYEPRFQLLTMAFDGPICGEMRAFERARPQAQPGARDLAALVGESEFAGTRSLVIGGSRGLGELTAKLLAAGGGQVCVSYAAGQVDAQAVADDINAAGRGRCDTLHLDLAGGLDAAALSTLGPLDAVYYFATPRIYRKTAQTFDRASFDAFADFYLDRFAALCESLDRSPGDRPVRVFLPSTVFIDERPKGMAAYAMIKAAAEILAAELNRSLRRVRVRTTRLPRLATDQTAGVRGLAAGSNVGVMLDVVRSMQT